MRAEIARLREELRAAKQPNAPPPAGHPRGRWARNPGLSGETPGEGL